jgi:hypothetical protein
MLPRPGSVEVGMKPLKAAVRRVLPKPLRRRIRASRRSLDHAILTLLGWEHRLRRGFPTPEIWTRKLGADGGQDTPILVVVAAANPFTHYLVEILEAEGLNSFSVTDISAVTPEALLKHDVALLGEAPLTRAQADMFGEWVNAGGNLIAMRPDQRLAVLLGLGERRGRLEGGLLLVDTSVHPGTGIVGEPIQFHGPADLYEIEEVHKVATLWADALSPTSSPAITVRRVGTAGGHAAAFTYDLARSVVYTRQGNPEWARKKARASKVRRSSDLFRRLDERGTDHRTHWVHMENVGIPQADEQQRLLVNLISHANRHRRPLPRFWYFPSGKKAVVVMTGDDHGHGGTIGRFDRYLALDPADGLVDDWARIRATSYVYPTTPITDEQASFYTEQGFEIGVHVDTGCRDWRPSKLGFLFERQMNTWAASFPGLPAPTSIRTHCVAWSDWATQPKIERSYGIRMDTNYYYYPAEWVAGRQGFFTGSGMPMRFADGDGTVIDVYQAATQMTDESGQAYPETAEVLLDRARGPEGFYGVFVANVHTDREDSSVSDAIVAAARARGVPVVSARQMVQWLDGRNGSRFEGVRLIKDVLRFGIEVAEGADGLVAMVPAARDETSVENVTREGEPVSFRIEAVKGVEYAMFQAVPGQYAVRYRHQEGSARGDGLAMARRHGRLR